MNPYIDKSIINTWAGRGLGKIGDAGPRQFLVMGPLWLCLWAVELFSSVPSILPRALGP